jgi:hypothetical protein
VTTNFRPKKDVEIGGLERAVVHEAHHLQDSKQIPFAFFDLGALVPRAAVFDMQWMQMVSLRKLVQSRARGVGDVMPLHTLRIALLVWSVIKNGAGFRRSSSARASWGPRSRKEYAYGET